MTEGLPAGRAARTCYLTFRSADRIGVTQLVGADLFYGALLKDLDCSSDAAAIVELFGTADIDRSTGDHLAAEAVTALRDVL